MYRAGPLGVRQDRFENHCSKPFDESKFFDDLFVMRISR